MEGYYPDMMIDVHNRGKVTLKEYAKDDPDFMVARLCVLSKEYEKCRDRIAELEAERDDLRAKVEIAEADFKSANNCNANLHRNVGDLRARLEQIPKDVLRWIQTDGTTAELVEIVGGLDAILRPDFTCPGCEDKARRLEVARLALTEIAKGEGRYSRDQLEHADNCINDMKELAIAALAADDHGKGEGTREDPAIAKLKREYSQLHEKYYALLDNLTTTKGGD